MGVATAAGETGIHRISLSTVGSTNDEALHRANAGARLPLWVTAERQISGRGRRGAYWASESGNLYASIALRFDGSARLAELPLLASVALHDALAEGLGESEAARLAIKWPNDILVDGKKVSGILAESQPGPDDDLLAVVGVGVNLVNHPAETRHPATNLAAEGIALGPADLFESLARCMAFRLAQWQKGDAGGFGPIRAAWLERASGLGEGIEIRLPGETLFGRFAGMDETGRLILRQPGQSDRLVSAGEVFFTDRDDTEYQHGA